MNKLKTIFLMVGLTLIFIYIGEIFGGYEGMRTAFFLACAMNFYSYFFSDTIVLNHYKAKKVNERQFPVLYHKVEKISAIANLPVPKVYIIPDQVPNAFATGRNPKHAAVAVTEGLLEMLSPEELEGVLAHEMSHVHHYDILIGSVAAVFAGAIALICNGMRYVSIRSQNQQKSDIAKIVAIVLMPIAATIIQMSISRTREYAADRGAAELTHHPEYLISALEKLENNAKNYQMQRATSQTAHMFIVSPFSSVRNAMTGLFSTHPSTENRIKKLSEMIGRV